MRGWFAIPRRRCWSTRVSASTSRRPMSARCASSARRSLDALSGHRCRRERRRPRHQLPPPRRSRRRQRPLPRDPILVQPDELAAARGPDYSVPEDIDLDGGRLGGARGRARAAARHPHHPDARALAGTPGGLDRDRCRPAAPRRPDLSAGVRLRASGDGAPAGSRGLPRPTRLPGVAAAAARPASRIASPSATTTPCGSRTRDGGPHAAGAEPRPARATASCFGGWRCRRSR